MKTLIALAAVVLTACTPAPPEFSNTAEADAAWADVSACYAQRGLAVGKVRQPDVIVREDCRSKWASQDFIGSGGGWVFGEANTSMGYVMVCPDLAALEHEMSHVMHRSVLYTDGLDAVGAYKAAPNCFGVVL
ncbi:MAG: hypothetical protein WC829_02880 [Hyphomicrobium sp.]|jgi:hypothetical protein